MLNSKYAPIVALTVVAIIFLAVLGYFLAVKPQLDEASDIRAQASAIRENVTTVENASAQIDAYDVQLQSLEPIDDDLALNAPSVFDRDGVAARITEAVTSSGLELVSRNQSATEALVGWEADPASLVSTQVASLFAVGPVGTGDADEYVAVVTPVNEAGPVAQNLAGIGVTVGAVGTLDEAYAFIATLNDPDSQLFQVFDVRYEARQTDSAVLPGVSPASDGDLMLSITGYLYLLDPDSTIEDEDTLASATPPGESPFLEPEDAPDQPGAD